MSCSFLKRKISKSMLAVARGGQQDVVTKALPHEVALLAFEISSIIHFLKFHELSVHPPYLYTYLKKELD